jgi:hypothetical protein
MVENRRPSFPAATASSSLQRTYPGQSLVSQHFQDVQGDIEGILGLAGCSIVELVNTLGGKKWQNSQRTPPLELIKQVEMKASSMLE